MKKKSLLLLLVSSLVLVGFASMFFTNSFPFMKEQNTEPVMFDLKPGDPYTADWAKVDSLERQGLPESAQKLVNEIMHKAQREQNQAQHFRCLLYTMKYTNAIQEDALVKNVEMLSAQADSVPFPLKPLVHSVLAQHYHAYFQQNSWRFYNRSETEAIEEKDLRTWDRKKIITTAAQHYHLSLESPDSLRRVSLAYFDQILTIRSKSRMYRPSLYDLLAWRAFDFFRNDEMALDQPAYKFQIEGDDFFKDDAGFVAKTWVTKDSSSNLLAATQILQELTRQHMWDKDPSARVFVARERLAFGKQKAISDLKDSLYLKAVEKMDEATHDHPVSAYLLYDIATEHRNRASNYNPTISEDFKDENNTALKYCEQAISRFPDADGTIYCSNLKLDILAKSMTLVSEKINPVGKPFLNSLEYRNVEKVWFRAIRMTEAIRTSREELGYDAWAAKIAKEPAVKEWTQALPSDPDHNTHHVQLVAPELPSGEYIILVSSSAEFKTVGEGLAFEVTHISNLGFSQRNVSGGVEFVVFDRTTGQPLPGVEAQAMERYYDYDKRKYMTRMGPKYTTDKDGFFTLRTDADYKDYAVDFKYKGDMLSTDDRWYVSRYREQPPRMEKRTFFFLDRGIYRPGQTIYFKGITVETDGQRSSIVTNYSSTVDLYDANYQKVTSLSLKTNEYGSFSGTFTAPQGQLNGQMHIQNPHGSTYFSVEDYKRPKFEVNFDPIKGSFKLGEKVKVTGKAVAYAGSNIDGAEVKYRVVRTASFPWWGYWCWWRIMPPSNPMEITNGVSTTNEMGEFSVEFQALADRSLSPDLKPQFSYQVLVDVVDITGETHSSSAYLNVGYLALNADVLLNPEIEKGGNNRFKINAVNLNGQPEPAKGSITIHQLTQPDRVFRSRLWTQPDKFVMNEQEFHAKFPNDLWKNELDEKLWPKKKEVLSINFDTEKDDTLDLKQCKSWEQGRYVLELKTTDKFGSEIKSIRYFNVSGPEDAGIASRENLWYMPGKLVCEPGQTATFTVGTAQSEIWLLYEIEHMNKTVSREWIKLPASKRKFSIPVEEKHRGNFGAHLMTVKDGRFSQVTPMVSVPWSNKTLKIEYATFRDKLQPGSKEEWTVKVKGPDGEKVAAELVAGMYDASLDVFRSNYWSFYLNPSYYAGMVWQDYYAFSTVSTSLISSSWNPSGRSFSQDFDEINWFGYPIYSVGYGGGGWKYRSRSGMVLGDSEYEESDSFSADESVVEEKSAGKPMPKAAPAPTTAASESRKEDAIAPNEQQISQLGAKDQTGEGKADLGEVKVRTNLNETAFFFPELRTDDQGNVIIRFTMPEALTRWKFMTLAHTTDLKVGYKEGSVVTQKELMVMPNAPRFFRENDQIIYMAKISNLSDKDLSGQASLELFDALTMKPIDAELANGNKLQSFSVKKGQSVALSWPLKIPAGIQAVTHRVKAAAGSFSDGEESALPVLTNSMLVTEAMPLPVRPLQTKTFEFKRLMENKSTTLRNHKLTLEFTSNPAWYAVQALPYMMEYPYECVEQTFSRFYANSLASHIANKHPRIKAVFDQWKSSGKEALLSNLEKNQELKYLLLEETPWVMNAQSETERKKRVGLLFDLNRMSDELERAKKKLIKAQVSNGGFTWFPGMHESRYITQHIVCGFGHLDHLGVTAVRSDKDTWNMLDKAVRYLDERIREDYEWLLAHKVDLKEQNIGWDHVHYLYARSYFKDVNIRSGCQEAVNYYIGQAKEYWTKFNKYNQGMIALALHRGGDKVIPPAIMKSIKEHALKSEEMGMYWKGDSYALYWYQAPIETQALLIEAFDEVSNDQETVEEMKLWLLKQKQTQDWKTTKATVEACYALLLRGSDFLAESKLADITIGGKKLDPLNDPTLKVEAGTGYFKTSWSGSDIKPEMGKVEVKNNNKVAAWGAVYWQYFEQLDKITFAENKVSIQKALFLEENTPTGPKISPIDSKRQLKPGDKVKVRIIIETDRDMEYVHMKDMRASGFEPINTISRYKWQDGLGYYESTRDAATNFFFDWLPKGKYVFEYPLRATHQGDFSNGITTIQCMYAPEFTSHSEGIRVKIGG